MSSSLSRNHPSFARNTHGGLLFLCDWNAIEMGLESSSGGISHHCIVIRPPPGFVIDLVKYRLKLRSHQITLNSVGIGRCSDTLMKMQGPHERERKDR